MIDEELKAYVSSLRNSLNTVSVDYIIDKWINREKSRKQMRASFIKTRESSQWHAQHGQPRYREVHQAEADLFTSVIDYIDTKTPG